MDFEVQILMRDPPWVAVNTPSPEREGVSVFSKDPVGSVFHTYSAYARGIDILDVAYHYLDVVPKGWDVVGHAFPQFWVRRYDEYGDPSHINTEYYDVTKNL